MYELKKNGKVFTSKFVGIGPSSYGKRIYRAAVSQRFRNTALLDMSAATTGIAGPTSIVPTQLCQVQYLALFHHPTCSFYATFQLFLSNLLILPRPNGSQAHFFLQSTKNDLWTYAASSLAELFTVFCLGPLSIRLPPLLHSAQISSSTPSAQTL